MVKRPTIPDLARAAGVSVSTINRVINSPDHVRQPTRERVLRAAQGIGFYGIGVIEFFVQAGRELHRPGVHLRGDRLPSGAGHPGHRAALSPDSAGERRLNGAGQFQGGPHRRLGS
ncbi:LacI family DNA-binding transcriptional regulator [Mameliella sp.]|uniref:LacI family DNA-binding transcriptional regulator n=1 Tax=Mameliella sp. TaxID=1924940 RepID=UPI003BAB06D9